jgi:hypothetical protein
MTLKGPNPAVGMTVFKLHRATAADPKRASLRVEFRPILSTQMLSLEQEYFLYGKVESRCNLMSQQQGRIVFTLLQENDRLAPDVDRFG